VRTTQPCIVRIQGNHPFLTLLFPLWMKVRIAQVVRAHGVILWGKNLHQYYECFSKMSMASLLQMRERLNLQCSYKSSISSNLTLSVSPNSRCAGTWWITDFISLNKQKAVGKQSTGHLGSTAWTHIDPNINQAACGWWLPMEWHTASNHQARTIQGQGAGTGRGSMAKETTSLSLCHCTAPVRDMDRPQHINNRFKLWKN